MTGRSLRVESLEDRRLLATIMLEDFEDATVNYTAEINGVAANPDALGDLANRDFYGRVADSALPAALAYSNVQGSSFYGAEDIDGALPVAVPNTQPLDLLFSVNIAGFTNLGFEIFVAEDDDGTNQDWDAGDSFLVSYQIDGGGFNNLFALEAEEPGGDTTNNRLLEDTNFDGIGDGTEITDTFTNFGKTIAGTGATLDLRIRLVTTATFAGDEDIAFDNVHITGDVTAVPTASLSSAPNVGEPEIGDTSYLFDVTYTDDTAINVATIDTNDVTVERTSGGGSVFLNVTNVSVSPAGNGSPRVTTYTATPPSGAWDSGDNGTYTISVNSGQVCNTDGAPLCVAAGSLGIFTVAANNTNPIISNFLAEDVIVPDFGDTSYSFTIEYTDVGGIDVSSIDTNDVSVSGPAGVTLTGAVVSPPGDGSPRTATYTFTTPGGSWDAGDAGTYTIGVNGGQVLDVLGASVAANLALTSFEVIPGKLLNETFETDGNGTRYSAPGEVISTPLPSNDYFARVTTADISTDDGAYVGFGGASFWAAEDTTSTQSISFTVPIAGFNNLGFSGLIGAGNNGATPNYDTNDFLRVIATVDAGTPQTLLEFTAPSLNSTLEQTIGGSINPTLTLQNYTSSITGTGTTLTLEVVTSMDANNEEVAFDDIMVTGDPIAGAPTATLSSAPNVGEPEIGDTSYSFDVTYSDDNAVDVSTIGTTDVTVERTAGGGAVSLTVTGVTVNPAGDGTPRVATYTVTPPGGAWDSGDNGTYTISMVGNEVCDLDPLCVAAGSLGTFTVAANNTPPSVTDFFVEDVIFPNLGDTSYSFTIEYTDVGGIDVGSIDIGDVTVRDPSLNPLTVTSGTAPGPNGSPKTATYTITPPGGAWDAGDVGTYTIELNGSEVFDEPGLPVPGSNPLTTFEVIPNKLLNETFETDGNGSRYTAAGEVITGGPPSNDYFARVTTADISTNDGDYTGFGGGFFWAAEDTIGTQSVVFNVPITGLTNLEFMGLFGAGNNLGSPTYDAGDFLSVTAQIDGGTVQELIRFEAEEPGGDTTNNMILEDTNFDGVGDGTAMGLAMSSFGAPRSIMGTGNTLTLDISVSMNSGDEEVAFDDIMVTGALPDAAPTVTITTPSNGDNFIEGTPVAFTATATDDVGVTQVEFFVDGVSIGVDTTAPYSTTFIAPSAAGTNPLPLAAVATDTASQTASDSISINILPVATSPIVTDVLVSGGAGWTLAPFSLFTDPMPGAPLPWVNINTIEFVFDQDVDITQQSFTLTGVNTPNHTTPDPGIVFSYNNTTFTASYLFPAAIETDKLLINLDGESTDTSPVQAAGGGPLLDGSFGPGTDFEQFFDILRGDATRNGSTTVTDLVNIGSRVISSIGDIAYTQFFDVNGSGSITVTDLVNAGSNVVSTLPPGSPADVQAPLPAVIAPVLEDDDAAGHFRKVALVPVDTSEPEPLNNHSAERGRRLKMLHSRMSDRRHSDQVFRRWDRHDQLESRIAPAETLETTGAVKVDRAIKDMFGGSRVRRI